MFPLLLVLLLLCAEIHQVDVGGDNAPIPTSVDESALASSVNAEIPGEVIRPGLEMVIEVDPDNTLDPAMGVAKRIPATGRLAVDVESMPPFDLTVIPFIWTEINDSSIMDLVNAMAADPENHEMLGDARELLPIGELSVMAHAPVMSSSNSAFALLGETRAIRTMEGGTGHYKGMMSPPVTGAGGVAELPGRSSFSQPYPGTIVHELGHNLNLRHAPCGGAGGPAPGYPYQDRLGLRLRFGKAGTPVNVRVDVLLRSSLDQRLLLRRFAPLPPRGRSEGSVGNGRCIRKVAPDVGRNRRRQHPVP